MQTSFYFLLFIVACASAAELVVEWNQLKPAEGELWLEKRGYFPASTASLKNGSALVFSGGLGDAIMCCMDSWAFTPLAPNNRFRKMSDIPDPKFKSLRGHTQIALGRHIYAFGGDHETGTATHNELYQFSMETEKWTLFDNKGPKLGYHSASAWGERSMIVFGGRPSVDEFGGYENDVWIFDIVAKTWKQIKNPQTGIAWPTARASHSSVVLTNGKGNSSLLVVGGNDFNGCVHDQAWLLDLQTMRWDPVTMPSETVYCLEDMSLLTMDIVDPTTKKTKQVAVLAAGWGYMVSIWNEDVFTFDLDTRAWTKLEHVGDQHPGHFRGMGSAVITPTPAGSAGAFATIGGCWQVDDQEYCEFDNQMWVASLKYKQ